MTKEEAINKIKTWDFLHDDEKEVLETLIPELKESKDEKIRKAICGWIYTRPASFFDNGISKEEMLAWLEKQGKKQQGESALEVWKDIRFEVGAQASGNRHEPNYSDDATKMFSLNDIDEIIEKISEQKFADKVEPKFHKGEWIVDNCGYVWKIEGILNQFYLLEDVEGGESRPAIGWVNETFHLWTIQDAKDGDVLWHSDSASNGIFIFKEIRHDGKVLCYCDYDSEDHFCTGEYHTCCWSCDKYIKPATKEQRGLLFAKMKEAGYVWDSENKQILLLKAEPTMEIKGNQRKASVKHEGWANVYSDNGYHLDKEIWEFEENAIEIGKEFPDYVATVKIEWED